MCHDDEVDSIMPFLAVFLLITCMASVGSCIALVDTNHKIGDIKQEIMPKAPTPEERIEELESQVSRLETELAAEKLGIVVE